jgi:phosphate-selective porin OprO/OprP
MAPTGPSPIAAFLMRSRNRVGSLAGGRGSADAHGSANRLWMTDVGINWWMTQYLKMVFDWNHAEFHNPVTYNVVTQKTQSTSNILWWRIQLFF